MATEESSILKGYLFNLIVYTHEKRRFAYFQQIIAPFINRYPSRTIFIECLEDGSQDTLKKIPLENGGTESLSDQLLIQASRPLLHQVPFLVLPELIPDLPIYLVWGQNPVSENEILAPLQKIATRFVFDSACTANFQEFCAKMYKKILELKMEFMDVSWAYASGWRDAIFQTFKTKAHIDYLNQLASLKIQYNNLETKLLQHTAIQAIYLQGWLAAQLGWKFDSLSYGDHIELLYTTEEGKFTVLLEPQKRTTLESGRVFEMEFVGNNHLTTTLTLADKQSKVVVYLSTPQKCELPFSHPIPDLSKGLSTMKEVFYYQSSKHYENMLKLLKEIPWKEF